MYQAPGHSLHSLLYSVCFTWPSAPSRAGHFNSLLPGATCKPSRMQTRMTGLFVSHLFFFFLFETLPSNSCPGGIPVVQPACIHSFIHPLPTRHPSVHPSVNVSSSSVFTLTAPVNSHSSQILIGHWRTGFSYCHNKQTVTQSLLRPNPPDAKQAERLQCPDSQLTLTLTCWEIYITRM